MQAMIFILRSTPKGCVSKDTIPHLACCRPFETRRSAPLLKVR